jgi:hypothetical protein
VKYALVLTDSGLIPGTHGLLNGLLYYGCAEQVEVHYLYWPDSPAEDAVRSGLYDFYPHLVAHSMGDLLHDSPLAPLPPDYACFHLRWFYAGKLPHEAVSIWDADMTLAGDLRPWFEVAATTGMFLTPNNDFSGHEPEAFSLSAIIEEGDASVIYHNMPCFWDPGLWGDLACAVARRGLMETRTDCVALTCLLAERGLLDRVLTLPNWQWVHSHWYNLRLCARDIAGKRYLALHQTGDRLTAFHRRWWEASTCDHFLGDCVGGWGYENALHNITLFHEHNRFLNQDCAHALDYDFTWTPKTDSTKGPDK